MNKWMTLIAFAALPGLAWAQGNVPGPFGDSQQVRTRMDRMGADPADNQPQPFGTSERAWIGMQVDGSQSVATVPPLPGEVASRIYQRYLKSFDHPIPNHFSRPTFSTGGGSSGGSSGGGSSGGGGGGGY